MSHESDAVRDAWEKNGRWWSDRFGEGNDFHLNLVAPPVEKLLDIQADELILDIACGNGAFSRRMADLGAKVVGFDFSTSFIECAKERSSAYVNRIEYHVMDATNVAQMLSLGEGRFSAAVSNMALMDMSNIEPLAECLPKLLKPGGRFVFSIMHPCFNNPDTRMAMEEEDREGELVTTRSIKIGRYLTPFSSQGVGIVGQPVPQTYFHRSLQDLLRPFLAQGMSLTGLEERAFADVSDARGPLSWDHFAEIPPVLAVRMSLL
jgi:2-polyprenyl-3-methyl-5-hydroxy-6-metoxy-1,4-benzoquinol methylase